MKVGLLIPTLHKGGAEKIAAEISKSLPEEWGIYLILFEDKVSYEYRGKKIVLGIPRGNEFINILKRARKIEEIADEKGLEVIMAFDEIAALSLILSKTRAGKIIAIHKSLIMADKEKGFLMRKIAELIRKLYNKACKVITVSKGIKEELISFGVKEDKIEVIYNPHDIERIRKEGKEDPEIDLPEKFVLNIGRAERQKAQWYLIRAFKIVKENEKNIKLVLVARGELLEKLKSIVREEKLEGDVVIIDGWINNLYSIINKAEVVVLSSLYEGFPNVLIEALALGKPIVSTDCRTGPSEIVGKIIEKNGYKVGERGVLVKAFEGEEREEEKEKELGEAIIRVLKDERLKKMFENNAKEYVEQFKKEKVIKKYKKVFEECRGNGAG